MTDDPQLYQSILASWDRCSHKNILRDIEKPLLFLSKEALAVRLKKKQALIDEFENFMMNHLAIIKNVKGDYCFLLLDEEGYLLSVRNCIKNFESQRKYQDFFISGVSFSEESLGINAVALSQGLRRSVYMHPFFHYCNILKTWYQYCATIGRAAENSKGYVSVVNIRNPVTKALEGFIDILAFNLLDSAFFPEERSNDYASSPVKLSKQQNTIIRMIAQGLSDENISQELKISLSTVKYHNQNIFKKLNATCRAEAVAKALMLNEILFSDLRNSM